MIIANYAAAIEVHTNQLAFVHDELQYETTPEYADSLKAILELAAKNAGLSGVPDSLEMAFTVPNIKKEIEEAYITEFYKLLLIHPKFYTGNTYGVD